MPNRSQIERTIASALKVMLSARLGENVSSLPGTPDLVIWQCRLAVFVHGCFWHSHSCMRGTKKLGQNSLKWIEKLGKTVIRDQQVKARLESMGWRVIVLWECDIRRDLPAELGRVRNEFERTKSRL